MQQQFGPKAEDLNNSRIENILIVHSGEDILESHFFLESKESKRCLLSLAINSDGESISVDFLSSWPDHSNYEYEAYRTVELSSQSETFSDISKLLQGTILDINFGAANDSMSVETLLYYCVLQVEQNEVVFFNNGDRGYFAFNDTENIKRADIYGVSWSDRISD